MAIVMEALTTQRNATSAEPECLAQSIKHTSFS
jgi:hypothetical protein